MKAITTLFITSLFIGFSSLYSQDSYAYDWHASVGNTPMLKLKTTQDGLYRISQQSVVAQIPDLGNAPADSLRLFFRGKEVPVHVHASGGTSWSAIEFLGTYHDGGEDRLLYRNNITGEPDPSAQTHMRISLFTDTSAYYLAASGNGMPLRMNDNADFDYNSITPESSLNYTASLNFYPDDPNNSQYIISGGSAYDSFNALNSDYIMGQGYMSRAYFGQNDPQTFMLSTPDPTPGAQRVTASVRVFGRSNTTHRFRFSHQGMSQTILDTSWNSNQIYVKTYTRSYTVDMAGQTTFRCEALGRGNADNNHLVWIDVKYRHQPGMDDDSMIVFNDVPPNSLLRLFNCVGRDSVWAFSKESGQRFRGVIRGDTAWINLRGLQDTSDVIIVTDQGVNTPFIESKQPKPLCHPDSGAHMILITHRGLEASARDYAAFRDSTGFSVKVYFVDEIYESFGYGAFSPLAIQRFCNCAMERWNTTPRYLLIWGDGEYLSRPSPNDQVPTWGFPASDFPFTAPLNSADFVPQIPVGRVSITHDSSGYHYLEKARVWADVGRKDDWMLKGTFVGGGASAGERSAILRGLNNVRASYSNSVMNGDASCFYQRGNMGPLPGPDTCHYTRAGLRFHFGHSSSNIFDSYLENPSWYDATGTSSLVFAMGSYGGDFTVENSMAERWLRYPKKGAVAWIGNTSAGYLSPLKIYSEIFMPLFADKMVEQPIGDVMKATIEKFKDSVPGIQTRNHCRQMALLGDPSLVLSRRRYPVAIDAETSTFAPIIYPNPAKKRISIRFTKPALSTISLLNAQGQVVQQWEPTTLDEEKHLELLPILPAGYYMISVEVKGERFTQSVIIVD